MSEKSDFIQAKIVEIQNELAKPITAFQTGGFKPTGEKTENWIGRVFLCKADEAKPVTNNNGEPLYPLAQFYLPNLPFVPDELKHITWLTVFMGEEFPEVYETNGNGWLIREYTADDELVEYEYEQQGTPKPFPLSFSFKEQDFPLWDGGGVPSDLEDEICELEDDYDEERDEEKDDCDILDYYEDIVGDNHCHHHKFGGYPSFCQSGVEFENDCKFMFQISSDDKANFNVVDSGSLMFARNNQGDWVLYYDFC